jgi:putative membrane protein
MRTGMKEKQTAQQKTQKRILVLCVDRDGDLEAKAGIKTPVVGRTANLDAAVSLALRDPEEPDANAMFEAVRLNDRLQNDKKPEEVFEVATISGSELGGVSADRKLVDELNTVIDSFEAGEVILVSDGYSDEAVLPLVESRVPVSSVRRVVIKHSESIEETAALISRYLKLLWENPKYSRIVLGIPGLLFLLWGILTIAGQASGYALALAIIVGAILLFKGIGVDRAAKDFYKWAREYSPPPIPVQISNYAAIAGILCVIVSFYLGTTNAMTLTLPTDLAGWLADLPKISGFFIKGLSDLLVVGIGIILFGRSLRWYFERDARILRNAALIVSVAWSRWILEATANILINDNVALYDALVGALVFNIVVGILIGIASVLIIVIIHRSTKEFFAKSKEKVDEFGEVT